MARTQIPINQLATRGGVVMGVGSGEIAGDTVNGHVINANDGRVFLHARNSAAGTINLTLLPGISIDGFTLPSRVVTRVNAGDVLLGPFPVSMFGADVAFDCNSANWRFKAYQMVGAPNRSATPPTSAAAGSRVALPLTTISRAGIDITAGVSEVPGDAANDHYFANDGNVLILARATAADVAYNPQAAFTMDGQAVPDYVAIVQIASPLECAGPYQPSLYNQPDGNVYMNVSASTIRLRALWLPYQD